MSAQRLHRPVAIVVASAALSCAATLSVAWPSVLHADDDQKAAAAENEKEVPPGAAQFGNVAAVTELVKNKKGKDVRVRLIAYNTSKDREEIAQLDVRVERFVANPMSRSGPEAEIAWEESSKFVIPPGERLEREYVLPPAVVKAIQAAAKASAKKPKEDGPPPVITSYQASVMRPQRYQARS